MWMHLTVDYSLNLLHSIDFNELEPGQMSFYQIFMHKFPTGIKNEMTSVLTEKKLSATILR